MTTYSVAEAKNNLPRLIDQALQGEHVVITRHGNPVVELRPVQKTGRPMTEADVEWFRAHRVGKITPPLDAGAEVSRMRDEEVERLDRLP
ncbi:MAG TPA: type II toxin-antitoxin system prevent-host-death family antitoxin [Acetobacteraceae bacterium]|nr:type II toxin-antitoxin system prevent-host-death family antitoxin [Acetobacteraceae bacterium]